MDRDLCGKTIGGFEILRELGRGSMGVVYKAREIALDRFVAFKVVASGIADDQSRLARFEREARTAARLNHPNVVTIHSIGRHEDLHFITMEYVRGLELSEQIRIQSRIVVREALQIAAQIAGALAAAHALKVIHRDIKPHNIMLDPSDRVKVMDFGIAKVFDDSTIVLTDDGHVYGTAAYMSREQCLGMDIDGRSDIYSLGVVLYEMLAGRLPFTGKTPAEVIQKILNETPPPIQELNALVPDGVVTVLKKCLAKDVSERFATADELEFHLKSLLALEDAQHAESQVLDAAPTERLDVPQETPRWARLDRVWGLARRVPRPWALGLASSFAVMVLGFAATHRTAESEESPPGIAVPAEVSEGGVSGENSAAFRETNLAREDLADAREDSADAREAAGLIEPLEADTDPAERRRAVGLYSGVDGEVDSQTAAAIFATQAERGDPLAKMWVAWMRYWGRCGFPKDSDLAQTLAAEAISEVDASAGGEDSDADFLYGSALDLGLGVEPNSRDALQWIRSAADAGFSVAQNYLGWMILEGRGIQSDEPEALRWFIRAAKQGDTGAMHNAGWMVLKGQGAGEDPAEAMKWFRKGAKKGDGRCMSALGWMHEKGFGVQPDERKAARWYRKAAEAGDPQAMYLLGLGAEEGESASEDADSAAEWLLEAARLGHEGARTELGDRGQSW